MFGVTLILEPTTILAGVVFALSVLWWLATRRPAGLPPSPALALPFIGHLHLLDKNPRVSFAKWRQKYGDVFSLYMGGSLVIVLNGYDVIKEALVKYRAAFSHRPPGIYFLKNRGVVGSSGSLWKEQKKVCLEILRKMGLGKNVMAEKIQQEVDEYIKSIAKHQGEAFDPCALSYASMSNNICSIVCGQRFQYDDLRFLNFLSLSKEYIQHLIGTGVVNFFPALKYLPGDLFKIKRIQAIIASIDRDFMTPLLESHRKKYTEGEANDFIHAYLREVRKRETSGQLTTINDENLFQVIKDLFIAGTESTANTLLWTLVFFLHHPEVQEKCFQEIERVVGTERTPDITDKSEMTYTEATIMEVLRRANIVPLGALHWVPYSVKFRGYTLPRGTTLLTNVTTVLHDPDTWDTPLAFRPERFIGPDGKLTQPEEFIPFGIGPRLCLGETLARAELFLYVTTMVQRFRFVQPEGEVLPTLQGTLGLTDCPNPFKICAIPRDTSL